jgi:hypothetical protein
MVINQQKSVISLVGVKEVVYDHCKRIFHFEFLDFDEGIKYMGFRLKPNSYKKTDWLWLIAKLENV